MRALLLAMAVMFGGCSAPLQSAQRTAVAIEAVPSHCARGFAAPMALESLRRSVAAARARANLARKLRVTTLRGSAVRLTRRPDGTLVATACLSCRGELAAIAEASSGARMTSRGPLCRRIQRLARRCNQLLGEDLRVLSQICEEEI